MEDKMQFEDVKTPTLTFDPFGESVPEPKAEVASAPQEKRMTIEDEYAKYPLSEAEKQQVEGFAKQIDLYNSQMIMQYGAGAQKKISDFSESALENVRSKDLWRGRYNFIRCCQRT